jgi:dienelactone hydrolase
MKSIWSWVLLCGLLLTPLAVEAKTTVRHTPLSPDVGPFPADILTTADSLQKTGRRVNLPNAPACLGSDLVSCEVVKGLLNQLDGFSVKPQIRVCFSGPVDRTTLRTGMAIVPANGGGPATGVNQVFYDRTTSCALVKPDHVLNQSTRYLLLVKSSIRDAAGKPVAADEAFTSCANGIGSSYCAALAQALRHRSADAQGAVGGSLFTTMSATDWMEKARQFLYTSPVTPTLIPAGDKTVFDVGELLTFDWMPQTNISLDPTEVVPIPFEALEGVQRIAFGLYLSPNFLQITGDLPGTIAVTPTARPIQPPVPIPVDPSLPPGYVPISYHVFLPRVTDPTAKIPVVIYGHGAGDSQFGAPTAMASTLAKSGFATLAMEIVGHGYGPGSVTVLTDTTSGLHVVSSPGRGVPLQPDGMIFPGDGCQVPGPIAVRDCLRQSAIDVMALVQNIKANGLGVNLDPSRIYYVGQSLGSFIGSLVHAVEPGVKAAVFNVGGDSSVDAARLSYADELGDFYLFTYNVNLLAAVGEATADPRFDFFYPLRDRITQTGTPGIGDIQRAFEVADWLNIPGAPLAYAPHFKVQPLPGVPQKQTLFQFGFGDLEVPNPTESALVRAAVGPQFSSFAPLPAQYFRFDLAVALDPHLAYIFMPGAQYSILPHRIMANPTLLDPANFDELSIALEVQRQVARFFKSGTVGVLPPFFQNPILSTLPNTKNYTWPVQAAPAP